MGFEVDLIGLCSPEIMGQWSSLENAAHTLIVGALAMLLCVNYNDYLFGFIVYMNKEYERD